VSKFQVFPEGHSALKLPLLAFITKACLAVRGKLNIRLGKNKDATIKDFLRALSERPSSTLILLIDSDGPDDGFLRGNLMRSALWRKHAPNKLSTPAVHWMVHVMECWFIADQAALKAYYKKKFNPKALPKARDVETVSKPHVYKSLKLASGGKYDKASHAPKILEKLDPRTVRIRASNCDRFLSFICT
jgi:hypothetical protein